MDFSGVYLVEELHHDEGVEDDGVVLGGRRVERCVTAAVNVKDLFTCREKEKKKDSQFVVLSVNPCTAEQSDDPYQQRAE